MLTDNLKACANIELNSQQCEIMADLLDRCPDEITIPVFLRLQDNGDGGYSLRVYNTEEQLLNDSNAKTMEDFEDNPYELGYVESTNIKLKRGPDGEFRLNGSLYMHSGQ